MATTKRRLVPFRAAGKQPSADEFVRAQQEAQKVIDSLWDAIDALTVRVAKLEAP
jgi:hypothetical protein